MHPQALVIGGTGLIGRAVVRALAADGYQVRIHYHQSRQVAEELRRDCRRSELVAADLRDPIAIAKVIAGLRRLDLLVVAIGAYRSAPIGRTMVEDLDELWKLNLRAPLMAMRGALPALKAAGGQAILLTDIAAEQPWREHAAYAATKAGLAHAVRCLALELAPDVRVNAIAPGLVEGADGTDDATYEALRDRIPLGRAATPQEVADAVLLLARSPAPITGLRLAVDGGRHLGRKGGGDQRS
jgi:pteridine reductase